MIKMLQTFSTIRKVLILAFLPFMAHAQAPSPALVGYFHNWNDANAPYVQLDNVDTQYNIITVAFATPQLGTDYKMEFTPLETSQANFIAQIQTLHAQGRKVLISIGGATAPIVLDNAAERDTFVSTMTNIINTYGFDGMDIDLEGNSLMVTSGTTIANPTDPLILNLIDGVKKIMTNYAATNNHKMILTMAPETAYVQGGQSGYGSIWGAYLPVIHGLRDSLDILHVQLYNTGTMYGIDGNIYTQGTADFIIAMSEAVIQGFNTAGGAFAGLPASKVAVGLPACSLAAGGGFTDTATVKAAMDYLLGKGPKPGSYTLAQTGGYPDFRGMMTWSINWDAVASCGSSYEFAQNYKKIFTNNNTTGVADIDPSSSSLKVFPNPSFDRITILFNSSKKAKLIIYNTYGQVVFKSESIKNNESIDISNLASGMYFVEVNNQRQQIVKR